MSAYDVAFIGFGEAARAFVTGWREVGELTVGAYDLLFSANRSTRRPPNLLLRYAAFARLSMTSPASPRPKRIAIVMACALTTGRMPG